MHKDLLDDQLIQWLSMLLEVIDFSANNAAHCLKKFTSQKPIEAGQKTITTKEYKMQIPGLVSKRILQYQRGVYCNWVSMSEPYN